MFDSIYNAATVHYDTYLREPNVFVICFRKVIASVFDISGCECTLPVLFTLRSCIILIQ